MAKTPYFHFYVSDFLVGCLTFTNAQCGAYVRMLCVQWDVGYIEPKKTHGFLHDLENEEQREEVLAKFEVVNDGPLRVLKNKRLEETRAKLEKYLDKQRENGKKGGRPSENPRVNSGLSQTKPKEKHIKCQTSKNEEKKNPDKNQDKKKGDPSEESKELFRLFWEEYPPRNGKKLYRHSAEVRFYNLSVDHQRKVLIGLRNFKESELFKNGCGIKDPMRFIRDGQGNMPFMEWQDREVVTLSKNSKSARTRANTQSALNLMKGDAHATTQSRTQTRGARSSPQPSGDQSRKGTGSGTIVDLPEGSFRTTPE